MPGGIKKGEKHGTKALKIPVLGLLLPRNFSGLGLNGHFIQMFAIKSENILAGAPLFGNSLSIQSSTIFN